MIKNKICLVVSHLAGDEGMEYYHQLVDLSERLGVRVIWAGERIGESRGFNSSGEKLYRHRLKSLPEPSRFSSNKSNEQSSDGD